MQQVESDENENVVGHCMSGMKSSVKKKIIILRILE
jgi:hypothetical protein